MSEEHSAPPSAPRRRLALPFQRFLHVEAASGVVLAICTAIALIAANSPLQAGWNDLWNLRLVIGVGDFALDYPLGYWVNDALMALFFFVVGLEIKRELVLGELRERAARILPVAAALGGALIPAAIFLALQHDGEAARGWGVPMATDIAFVVGVMALFGPRVPAALKLFLLALAIVDDLMAVVVIALFYAETIHGAALGAAALAFFAMAAMRMLGVRVLAAYWAAGAVVWLATLKSGVHPTIAGVALGLLTPARPLVALPAVERTLRAARERFSTGDRLQRVAWAKESSALVQETVSPVERLEVALHPWVAFVILPVFALANAGVELTPSALGSPLALSIAVALAIGKPLGIVAATALIVRLGWARLPAGVSWGMIAAGGSLAGIGFTMALFIASMGLPAGSIDAGKTGVLLGSAVSALLGSWMLLRATRRHA